MAPVQVLAFDVYGTLLDTSSISQALVRHAGLKTSKAAEVSTLWRRYQLEYTWMLNSMKIYEPWNIVTKKSLIHATKDFGFALEDAILEKVMKAYENLGCFPDAPGALKELQASDSATVLVFSNGTQHMIEEALKFGTIHSLVAGSYVADSVQVYKPAPEIYKGLIKYAGKEANPGHCWLVSGNPFDVSGARQQGMNAIWVDRAKKGWTDQLGLGPTKIVNDLREIPALIKSMSSRL